MAVQWVVYDESEHTETRLGQGTVTVPGQPARPRPNDRHLSRTSICVSKDAQIGVTHYGGRKACNELAAQVLATPDLLAACKTGLELYDELAVETNPLACAARHGPDYEPPSWQEWNEMCLEVRGILQAAIAKAEGQPPPS